MKAGDAKFRLKLTKKIMTGSAIQNNTNNGGSRGLEVCLRRPFKNSQPFFFFFFFSLF